MCLDPLGSPPDCLRLPSIPPDFHCSILWSGRIETSMRVRISLCTACWGSAAPSPSLSWGTPAACQNNGPRPPFDLGAARIQASRGGLYPGGVEQPLPLASVPRMQMASSIGRETPRRSRPSGVDRMIAVGMSNTTHEFGFRAQRYASRAAMRDSSSWTRLSEGQTPRHREPTAAYWTTMQQRSTPWG